MEGAEATLVLRSISHACAAEKLLKVTLVALSLSSSSFRARHSTMYSTKHSKRVRSAAPMTIKESQCRNRQRNEQGGCRAVASAVNLHLKTSQWKLRLPKRAHLWSKAAVTTGCVSKTFAWLSTMTSRMLCLLAASALFVAIIPHD